MPSLDGTTIATTTALDDMGTETAPCSSGKEMRDGLMFTEVQRLQRVLEESNMAASQTESDLHHRCQVLAAQVDLLTMQLSEREGPNGAAAAAPDTPTPHVPLAMQPSAETLPGSPSDTFLNFLGSNGCGTFDEDEEEEEEFWELSILPGDVALDSSSLAATDPGAPVEANGHGAEGAHEAVVDSSGLDDTAMGDLDQDIGPRLTLVKSFSAGRGSMVMASRMETDAAAANDMPSTSSCHEGHERRLSDTSVVSSSSSGCCETDRATGYATSTRDLDAYTDISSLGGYTFGSKDMEQLIAESDALQLLVAHLSAALEQADDDKQHLEDYLRSMIEARTASMMQVHSGMAPQTHWLGLKNLQHAPGSKDESPYTELLQRLDHSRSALQQSTEAQKQLRKKADKLREAGDVLRSALGATETEMKLHMEKVGVLEAAQEAQGIEGSPESLQTLNERLQVVEAWRQRAKKAVESCSTAWMPSSHQSYYEHLDRTSKSQTSEILTLREENKNLAAQLADMSIQFAEADSEHLETKRALARSEQRMQELKQELEAAKAPLDATASSAAQSPPAHAAGAEASENGSASASGSPGLSVS